MSNEWRRSYRVQRNTTTESLGSGFEELDRALRRRIRGFAAQQLLVAFLLVSVNVRKIKTFLNREDDLRELAEAGIDHSSETPPRLRDIEGRSNYREQWPLEHLPKSDTAPSPPDDPPPA